MITIAGKPSGTPETYTPIPLEGCVAVGEKTVDGPDGDEPCIVLFFTDKTTHGFVLPKDDE